ncbi:helix-turn-helix domain-containing protein [Alicyclobacillus dauci]|uniref:Helix-turn-helix domain-containing protein n=1 Tax=Alicyclobacillus dauci TaxID=1475485 RepID=A0ABY6Z2D3_9BACL|nr:helix-turn-helix domain-containing protein [Alicyclobacillus dauci]WAH36486.1 helix-turn-helix domain-containing protein [Alicyclobacillus dauci]
MSDNTELRNLTDRERDQALARFRVIQAHLEDGVPLSELAKTTSVTLRTLQRWLKSYRDKGLVGLTRSVRSDQGTRRISDELIKLIEGFALQKPTPSIAYIYRKVYDICVQQQWSTPSYSQVYSIVQSLDPALVTLAHEGEKRYKAVYDLVYRREAMGPNGIWQADHTLLDIWVLDEKENPVRPWLTIVLDDYSRAVAGYFVSGVRPHIKLHSLSIKQYGENHM